MNNNDKRASTTGVFPIKSRTNSLQPRRNSQQLSKDRDKFYKEVNVCLRKIIIRTIQSVNIEIPQLYKWQLIIFQEKRSIKGIKILLKWKSEKLGIFIIIRLIFAQSYFKSNNKVRQGDVLVELDEHNFEIELQEEKQIQKILQSLLEPYFNVKSNSIQYFHDNDQEILRLLSDLLIQADILFRKKHFEKRIKNKGVKVNRKIVNRNYILYPSPVCLSWSPQGDYCLTTNKVPKLKKSYIATANIFKSLVELPKIQQFSLIKQDEQIIYAFEGIEQKKQQSIFKWDIAQEIELAVFQEQKNKFYEQRNQQPKNDGNISKSMKQSDNIVIGYLNRIPKQIKLIYERNFIMPEIIEKFHKQDKIRIFNVHNCLKVYQDQIIFQIQSIKANNHYNYQFKSIAEIILKQDFCNYPNLINQGSIDTLKYKIIKDFFKEKLNTNLCFGTIFKAMIIENEYFINELQKYFEKSYQELQIIYHKKISCLGSYLHFDEYESEKILMDLLQKYLKHKQQKKGERIIKFEGSIQRVKLQININNKKLLNQLLIDPILSQQMRVMNSIYIIIYSNIFQRLQYKQ